MVLGLRDVAGSVLDYLKVEAGDWLCVEAQVDVDAGGGNDGSIIVRVGDDQIRIGNLDQEASRPSSSAPSTRPATSRATSTSTR